MDKKEAISSCLYYHDLSFQFFIIYIKLLPLIEIKVLLIYIKKKAPRGALMI